MRWIAVVDNSRLAFNMYRLIGDGLGAVFRRFDSIESLAKCVVRGAPDVCIVNTSVLGRAAKQELSLLGSGRLSGVPVIFLCGGSEGKFVPYMRRIGKLLVKPFHPNDMRRVLVGFIAEGGDACEATGKEVVSKEEEQN